MIGKFNCGTLASFLIGAMIGVFIVFSSTATMTKKAEQDSLGLIPPLVRKYYEVVSSSCTETYYILPARCTVATAKIGETDPLKVAIHDWLCYSTCVLVFP